MIDDYNPIYPNLYVPLQEDHWGNKNVKSWTAQEVVDFITQYCGADVYRPSGVSVLLLDPEAEEDRLPSGIIIPKSVEEERKRDTSSGLVLDFGPDAYQDERRFPSGPYCRRGDWVLYQKYERRTIDIVFEGKIKKLIQCYDDKIMGITKDPKFINRTPLG